MAILVNEITTELNESIEVAKEKAIKILGLHGNQNCYITKTSIDARKGNIHFIHTVAVEITDEQKVYERYQNKRITLRQEKPMEIKYGNESIKYRPVIVGLGPAGMFCGLLLAKCGYAPLILERGKAIEERIISVDTFWNKGILDTTTNVQFGEGGAGTFSDGKLTTRIGDSKCTWVLQELVRFGAPSEICQKAKPHIGTDLLRNVVAALRTEIIALGGEVRFQTKLIDLEQKNGFVCAITSDEEIQTSALVLATGHSARDTFVMLERRGMLIEAKPFSVGLRIEHLQSDIDKGLYGKLAGHPALPPGEYQLSMRNGERGVYSFCMCPGGIVVPAASEENMVVTNGMSFHARNGVNANSAIAVSVNTNDYGENALDGMRFQQHLESLAFHAGGNEYKAPIQDMGSFLNGKAGFKPGRVVPSYCRGFSEGNFTELFPEFITEMLKQGLYNFAGKLPGFKAPDTVLTGIETRTSSPVRILRNENYTAPMFPQVYPCAEGAGYAGGIMSAAVDGLKVALAIMERYAPPY